MFERKTVPRVERQQDSIVYRRRLDFEVKGLAQAFAQGEAEAAI